ncbi:MAG: hypothetical protein NTV63_01720 [Candidatus Woesearchaeota archaeon]|nr:hypothetical protein [Candidatus Woesearchaeota archaeon]
MATFLDVFFLERFSSLFVLILVYAVLYAILQTTSVLGKNKGINSLIAMAVSIIVLISKDAVSIITSMMPAFFMLVLFILLILIALRFLGMSESTISTGMQKWGPVHTSVLVIVAIIFVVALSSVYGNSMLSLTNSTGASYGQNVSSTIFNPKVLGMLFVLILGAFTVLLLTGTRDN